MRLDDRPGDDEAPSSRPRGRDRATAGLAGSLLAAMLASVLLRENDGLHWPHFDALKWPHPRRLLVSA